MVIIIQQGIPAIQAKMLKIKSFQVQPLQINSLTHLPEEDLNMSLTFSPRSSKDHSVTQTDCSQFSATKIVTDSQEELEQDQLENQQRCNNYHIHGCCLKGQDCSSSHSRPKTKNIKSLKTHFFENFPQLLAIVGQRTRSFLE